MRTCQRPLQHSGLCSPTLKSTCRHTQQVSLLHGPGMRQPRSAETEHRQNGGFTCHTRCISAHPADDGGEQQRDGAKAAVACGNLADLCGCGGVAGVQEGSCQGAQRHRLHCLLLRGPRSRKAQQALYTCDPANSTFVATLRSLQLYPADRSATDRRGNPTISHISSTFDWSDSPGPGPAPEFWKQTARDAPYLWHEVQPAGQRKRWGIERLTCRSLGPCTACTRGARRTALRLTGRKGSADARPRAAGRRTGFVINDIMAAMAKSTSVVGLKAGTSKAR